ncbi:MAG: hypothetical protein KKC64_16155 [Spirochaetes bacterium]|nr:hypothetical protein [Spirochaetota bacterium]
MLRFRPILLPMLLLLSAAILGSCATTRANQLLASQFSDVEKANRLFLDGLAQYNHELVENDNLKAIPTIRTRFTDTLALDPEHPQAQEYLDELNTLAANRFTAHVDLAWELSRKEVREGHEDYLMLLNLKLAADIKPLHPKVLIMKISTNKVRKAQILLLEEQLEPARHAVLAEKEQRRVAAPLAAMNKLLAELEAIDPDNRLASENRQRIDLHIATLVQTDVRQADQALSENRFAEAEASLMKAERSVLAISREKNQEIEDRKYSLYFNWASDQFSAKRYQTATEKVNLALAVRETSEALNLRRQINQAASVRNYDDEIDEILQSVDALIQRGNLTAAWQSINTNAARLRVTANRNRLLARRSTINEKIAALYTQGVQLYNEEDYEAARAKLLVVVQINPEYEQAQAYLTRLNTKLRALSGQ